MSLSKIVIFFPSIESGGADKNLFLISNFLSKHKDVSVVTSSIKYKNKFKNIKFISPNSNFFENFGRGIKTIISIIYLIKTILFKKKILIFSFQSNLSSILVCKILCKKIITRSNSFPSNWTKKKFKKIIFKKIYQLSDHCIVNSLETKKKFFKYYKIKSTCIYNPLNSNDIKVLSKKKVPNIFSKNLLKIINVGRLSEEKDHFTFIKALALIKDKIKFEAIIMGKGILKSKIKSYINNYGLKNRVKLIGNRKNPYPYIKQSNFVILTSKHEGLPNILLEAIILKKFVLSSDCDSGPREILSDGYGGSLFKVGNFKELSNQIQFYYKNPNICKKKIASALYSMSRFDFNINLNLYLKIINKLT